MKKAAVLGFLLVLLGKLPLWGVPPSPELVTRLKKEGRWESFVIQYKSWKDRIGVPNPHPYRAKNISGAYGKAVAPLAPPDTIKVVVIYAAPSDRPTSADGINVTAAQLQAILFGANPTKNITDYYKEVSYGQTVVVGTVFGPFTLPQTNAYYTGGAYGLGPYPNNGQKFVEDAVAAADLAGVDFSQFDADNNGAVDGLFVVHSGPGGEQTGNPNDIWSHANVISSPPRDGKTLSHYAIEPEQQGTAPIQIGVFCHEAGHALFGLPDLYDTDYSSSGLGLWDLMSGGNYLNGSRTPAQLSAWCKKKVGWLSPVNLTANQNGVLFPTVEFTPTVYRLWTHGNTGLEYFLVENRSRRGFDSYLPGEGLFIWHINDGVSGNNGEPNYQVALEQADGLFQLENGFNSGDGGDPYPGGTNNRTFDEFSNPNSKSRGLQATQVAVRNISNADSVMSADLEVNYAEPHIALGSGGYIFSAIYKGAPPAPRSLNITNDGSGSLNWRADWNRGAGWLSVTPDTGAAPTTASVSIVSTAVLPGVYTDTIAISSSGALNTPQKAWVSFQVTSLKGDLNRDGIRAPADIVELMTCVFSEPGGPDCENLVADMDCNGYFSATDVVILLQVVFLNTIPPC